MTVAPEASSAEPNAVIFSPVIPTSPTNVPPGVTTVPPLTIVSSRMLPPLSHHAERPVQHVHREVRIVRRDAHRGLDPQDVPLEAALADQDAHLARRFHDVRRHLFRRLLRPPITHELDAEDESLP